ncbi:AglZ/HisF2 family acetamidino modification protein [Pelagicoccus sp. SDUM812005]|uniref:AglZ/HisF2 family acetamidino modification protein n=1 Tax=Pelagicoccus sp. SDUM812005 TaxID=3041257 RepID=UPI00280E19EE|nr:AglZ/HisF2 family acetamidino modification protein [Pelagicoccus sp. SDUM812005]MDQ8180810.1 AglZ/HisF2 family acetamidino modification protein [Pelagicoccus sp. SDUM812005]
MFEKRLIPTLLYKDRGFVKTIQFSKPRYIGDPINTLKIFNEKEVDEIAVLDIDASTKNRGPDFNFIKSITNECFFPLSYGGGITTIAQIEQIFSLGIEKVILNSSLALNPSLTKEAARSFGNQSIVASIDVKQSLFGKQAAYTHSGKRKINVPLADYVRSVEDLGVGELVITSINREGTYKGYDLQLIENVRQLVSIPIIANGGASNYKEAENVFSLNCSAAAGSIFVYHGPHRSVLINYPERDQLKRINQ